MSHDTDAATTAALEQPADAHYHPTLVLGVLEYNRVNYLAAPPRIGKSCLLYPQLAQYLECRKFFGCTDGRHSPPRLGLITQLSAGYVRSRLKSMGIDHTLTTKILPIEVASRIHDYEGRLTAAIEQSLQRFDNSPEITLIDNLHSFLPSGEVSKFKEPGDFVIELNHLAERYHTTFLATVPMAKQKQNEGYIRAIDRIMGSVNWLHGAGTVACLDYPSGRVDETHSPRKLVLTFHGMPELETYWRFRDGKLSMCALSEILTGLPGRDVTSLRCQHLNAILTSQTPNQEIPQDVVRSWANMGDGTDPIPDSTLYRWIDEQIELGKMARLKRGVYIRTKPS